MSLSKYTSTAETTNLARLARLILGPCTDVLRDVLKKEILPVDLSKEFKKWFDDPANQAARNRFNKQYIDLIFPKPTKQYSGDYSDFDISLLYQLLRNILVSKIPPHTKGWGKDPDPGDRSDSANIERLRLIRNKYYGHINEFSISDSDFRQEWRNIRDIVVELEMTMGTTTVYQDAVNEIKSCSMDPEKEREYINRLAVIDELSNKVDNLSAEILNLKRPIPQNVKDLHDKEISKWEKEDKVFCEIRNYPSLLEKVRKQPCVVCVGVPGSGKTAMARHIALSLRKEDYEVVPVDEIGQIKLFCDPQHPQVFVMDDVVGKFGVQESKMDVLRDYENIILDPVVPDSKFLITCREAVFKKAQTSSTLFSEESNVYLFHSEKNELNEKDKISLMEAYNVDTTILSTSELESASSMFPLLCKLFQKEEFRSHGPKFFECPIPCVLTELDKMYIENKIQYGSLVLCIMNGSKLSEEILENTGGSFVEIKHDVCKKVKIRRETDSFEFVDALLEMNGTYTKMCDTEFTFIHDSMFEIIAHHFGQKFPDLILKYMSSSYISNYVKPQKDDMKTFECERKDKRENGICAEESMAMRKSNDLYVYLPEKDYPLLTERLFRDIEEMELYDVFMSDNLRYPKICQEFITLLDKKGYMEMKNLFLSLKSDQFSKLSMKRLDAIVKIWKSENKEFLRQSLLTGLREISGNNEMNIRVISWVIYYGHHQILRYIVNQTKQYQETQSKLLLSQQTESFELDHPETSASDVTKGARDETSLYEVSSTVCSSEANEKGTSDNNDPFVESTRLLVLGCYGGDLETVQILLKHVNKDALNRTSRYQGCIFDYWRQDTPLTAACVSGHTNIVKELIKNGAIVNLQRESHHKNFSTDKINDVSRLEWTKQCLYYGGSVDINLVVTPLVAACTGGHFEVVTELLKAGADFNAESVDESPLVVACSGGHVPIVNALLESGAEINPHCKRFFPWCIPFHTPLTAACYFGRLDVVKLLINKGANVNLPGRSYSPLSAAFENGHLEVAKELLKFCADVDQQSPCDPAPQPAKKRRNLRGLSGRSRYKRGYQEQSGIPFKDEYCFKSLSAILESLKSRDDMHVQLKYNIHFIIASNQMKRISDKINRSVVNAPLSTACRGGHLDLVKELISKGADVNSKEGNGTPLIAACERGQLNVVIELIKNRADVNLQGKNETPLIAACKGNHKNVVIELLNAGVDVNQMTTCKGLRFAFAFEHTTALGVTCKHGHMNLTKELLKAGADINPSSPYDSPLTNACKGGHVDLVKELLTLGAEVNPPKKYYTPLTGACLNGNVEVVKELLNAGADLNLENLNHLTPVKAAKEGNHENVIEVLQKAGAEINPQSMTNFINPDEGRLTIH